MKTKILIVDDEPLNLATLEAIFIGEGYELIFADNGVDACAKAQIERPDLILLDVMMPDLDGFEVTRRIRNDPKLGRVPILLVTALNDDQSRLEGLRAGADDFLTKPCRREEIRARVRTVASLNRFRTIAEQRERFERLFELSPDAIVVVAPNGNVVAANARAAGHRLGANLYERFDEPAATVLRVALAEALASKQPTAREVRLSNGEDQHVLHVRASAIPDGGATMVMLVFDDVTAEVRAREALEKLNAELEELVRARTRQLQESNGLLMSYANFVSHDLRSPLTVVKGYLSLVDDGVIPVNADAGAAIKQALSGTVMMQELIENILQLAQQEHDRDGEIRPCSVDPTPVVRRLALRMRELFPRPVPRFDIAELPRVGVSGVLVERVFYNLLANSLKFSAHRPEPRVEIGEAPSASGPVIFVRDNGAGFDARDADRLFHEFSRLSTATGSDGLGLGLSLVARLLRAHGGRIWADSTVGSGATFFVEFPPPALPVEKDGGLTPAQAGVGEEA